MSTERININDIFFFDNSWLSRLTEHIFNEQNIISKKLCKKIRDEIERMDKRPSAIYLFVWKKDDKKYYVTARSEIYCFLRKMGVKDRKYLCEVEPINEQQAKNKEKAELDGILPKSKRILPNGYKQVTYSLLEIGVRRCMIGRVNCVSTCSHLDTKSMKCVFACPEGYTKCKESECPRFIKVGVGLYVCSTPIEIIHI